MNAATGFPNGWSSFAWPINWDPSTRTAPTADAGEGKLPAQFCLCVRTPDMTVPGAAILFAFEVRDGEVALSQISSVGEDVTAHLVAVLGHRSPQEWQEIAVEQIAAYAVGDKTAAPSGRQIRRYLTDQHLEDVSAAYRRALTQGKPPTRAVQHHFDVSHSTAAKWVGHARRAGLLPKTSKGAAA